MTSIKPIETSVEDFISRYKKFAAVGKLYQQPPGSPLLEFGTETDVFYLINRTKIIFEPVDNVKVIINGQIKPEDLRKIDKNYKPPPKEFIENIQISIVYGTGIIRAVEPQALIIDATMPLVLSCPELIEGYSIGDWIEFQTQPPLHGFVVD